MRWWLLAALALGALGCARTGEVGAAAAEARDRAARGRTALAQKKVALGVVLLECACAREAADPAPFVDLARAELDLGRPGDAEGWTARGLAVAAPLSPASLELLELRDAALCALGRTADAVRELAGRVERGPVDERLSAFAAETLAYHGAVEWLVALAPKLTAGQQRRVPALLAGWLALRDEGLRRQNAWLGTARRLEPDAALTHAAAALVTFVSANDGPRALKEAQAAAAADPEDVLVQMAMVHTLSLLGRNHDTAQWTARALAQRPRRALIVARHALAAQFDAQPGAKAWEDRALELEPADPALRAQLSMLNRPGGPSPHGIKLLEAIPPGSKTARVHEYLGTFYLESGDLERAQTELRAALAAGADDPSVAWRLHSVLSKRGRTGELMDVEFSAFHLEGDLIASRRQEPAPYFLLSPR